MLGPEVSPGPTAVRRILGCHSLDHVLTLCLADPQGLHGIETLKENGVLLSKQISITSPSGYTIQT